MRITIAGILFVSAFIFGNITAFSQCGSCIDNYFSIYDEFKGAKAVFVGKVIEVTKIEESKNTDVAAKIDYYDFRVKFEVETAWKTDLPEIITVTNIESKKSAFKLGESYLVYAYVRHYDKENLRAHTGCCTRTKLLSKAEEDLQEFKSKGEKPTNVIKTLSKDTDKPNKSMDLRRKQRLSYLRYLLKSG
ncbi:MAG: hypothetical protein JWN60_203 [Acidobacteria bacterium]|jgi:hypothetical protein|nr:hypothetical protein [Acidobacteriota bacterium]